MPRRLPSWQDLQVFLAAVENGTYTAAAEALGVDRTTVGRRVQALERAIGQPLFELTDEGHQPTGAGRVVLRAARNMEAAANRMHATLARQPLRPSGRLRVAAPIGLGAEFMTELAGFCETYPGVQMELANAQDPLPELSGRKAHVALAVTEMVPEHLQGVRITRLSRALYASARYLEQYPADAPLGEHRWIGWGSELAQSLVARWMAAHLPAETVVTTRVNSWHAAREAVLAGLGIAPLWCFLADEDSRLVRIRGAVPELTVSLWLLWHRDLPPTEAVQAFIDFMPARLAVMVDHGPTGAPGGAPSV